MKLLLSGGGNPEDVVPLDELFTSQIDLNKPTLYIPVAMEAHVFSYDECFEWFKKTYRPYGLQHVDLCIDLSLAQNLEQYSAIFIGGGNTFKLLKEIKDSMFDIKLLEYLNNDGFVYGSSAGAIIFGKSIAPCEYGEYSDINHVGLTDLSGLNLAGGKDIFCHYSNGVNDFIKNYHNDLFVFYDESGLFIKNNEIEAVGKPFLCKADVI